MSSYNFKNIKLLWKGFKNEDFSSKNASFWQSILWAEILTETHQAQDILLCSWDFGEILIERRSIAGKYTALYALGTHDSTIHEELLEYIKAEIRQETDLFIQIEPLTRVQETKDKRQNKSPFRRFIEPVTAVLNLKVDEENLLSSFAEKGRYNIRLAQKRGVITRWVKWYETYIGAGKTYLEEFFWLLEETTERDNFSHNTLNYYRYFVETLEAHNAGGLLIAEKDGLLHAAGIFVYWWETAIYYYGASSSDRDIRRDMATYLLQWDAICEGMKRGCSEYDFLWISEDWKWKLAGVTEFKLRFNPEKRQLPAEIVIVYKPYILFILRWISKIRKVFK